MLGLSMLLSTAFCVATEAPATASTAPSTLCSGYTGCDQGTFTTHGYQNHSESSYWTMNPGDIFGLANVSYTVDPAASGTATFTIAKAKATLTVAVQPASGVGSRSKTT